MQHDQAWVVGGQYGGIQVATGECRFWLADNAQVGAGQEIGQPLAVVRVALIEDDTPFVAVPNSEAWQSAGWTVADNQTCAQVGAVSSQTTKTVSILSSLGAPITRSATESPGELA